MQGKVWKLEPTWLGPKCFEPKGYGKCLWSLFSDLDLLLHLRFQDTHFSIFCAHLEQTETNTNPEGGNRPFLSFVTFSRVHIFRFSSPIWSKRRRIRIGRVENRPLRVFLATFLGLGFFDTFSGGPIFRFSAPI